MEPVLQESDSLHGSSSMSRSFDALPALQKPGISAALGTFSSPALDGPAAGKQLDGEDDMGFGGFFEVLGEDAETGTCKAEEESAQGLGKASLFSGGVNLLKTFIGAGIISLPLAIAAYGLVSGMILMCLAAMASCLGLYFYIVCSSQVGGRRSSAASIAAITYPKLGYVMDACVALKSIGVSLSYLLLIGNIMSTFMVGFGAAEGSVLANPRIWIACFMGIVGPLSFLRRMDHLKYSSILGLASVAYLLGLSIFQFLSSGVSDKAANAILLFAPFSMATVSRFGIFIFAFTCHQNILPICNETKKNSVKQLVSLCVVSVSLALAIYVCFGTFSYVTYADMLAKGSMFTYYPTDQLSFQLARMFFALLLAFSYPLQVLPFRLSFSRLVVPSEEKRREHGLTIYLACTSFILLLTFGISMFNPDLSNVLSLVGSMTSSTICYIIPSLFYLKLARKKESSDVPQHPWLAYGLLAFGVVVFGVCSVASIMNFIR